MYEAIIDYVTSTNFYIIKNDGIRIIQSTIRRYNNTLILYFKLWYSKMGHWHNDIKDHIKILKE